GRTEYDAITLERGVTHDLEFEQWANKVWDYPNAQAAPEQRTQEVSLADFRKDIIIDVFNEAGQKVISYLVYRCCVSEFQALPDPRPTPERPCPSVDWTRGCSRFADGPAARGWTGSRAAPRAAPTWSSPSMPTTSRRPLRPGTAQPPTTGSASTTTRCASACR